MADKLRKASSVGVANVATVASTRGVGETTLSVSAGGLLNWATATSVDFTVYTLVNGVVTDKSEWTGTADVDNDLITDMELTNGTDTGNAADDVVICVETAAWVNDLIDTLLTNFNQTGNLKADVVAASNIINAAVTTVKLADSAVTEVKLGTGAVTNAKIGTGAVTEAKIGTGAVTNAKLGSTAVTTAKMDADARKQTLDINGSTTIVFSTASTQPSAQSGKTIIWFAPA
jgi:hypothetical protein